MSLVINSLGKWAEILLHGFEDLVSRFMPSKGTGIFILSLSPFCNGGNELLYEI